jgi:transposase-like protein
VTRRRWARSSKSMRLEFRAILARWSAGRLKWTLNAMLDAEADQLCGAGRYERSKARQDTRSSNYERTLHTKAGDVSLTIAIGAN